MNLYVTYESRGTLRSFTFFITKLNLEHNDKFGPKVKKELAFAVRVLETMQNRLISRYCFAEDGKEI